MTLPSHSCEGFPVQPVTLSNKLSPVRQWGQDKRVLWTGAYFVASCGGVTIDQLKKYVENQDSPDF
ncbi:hypothetical protein MICAF_5350003 [Microcystis aeruginosa PCC 9807]|uniref:Transposase IS200-like domain-containing protein n=1 Tax=Microcystis aeruginosa PCC 9807 TaxID=1160283 RepID=I4HCB2_MICAE|nr:hypothetical protein MICAF_5350003 [Microcystis aeruginosa PCC 9807]